MENNNEKIISHYLARRFCTQLGARTDLIHKVSACHKDNHSGTIKIQEEENGQEIEKRLPIWKAKFQSDLNYKTLLVNFGTDNEPEFIIIIAGYSPLNEEEAESVFGLHFSWESDDSGAWFTFVEDWVPLSFHQKLTLCAWLDAVTQAGVQWGPDKSSDTKLDEYLRKFLIFI